MQTLVAKYKIIRTQFETACITQSKFLTIKMGLRDAFPFSILQSVLIPSLQQKRILAKVLPGFSRMEGIECRKASASF